MKKCLYGLFALLLAAPVFAANNIKMVTYFPVPYASYGDLGVTGTCDVGLLDNCELQSGSSLKVFARSGDTGPLNTGALTVKGGSLDLQSTALNSKISGTSLTAGQTGSIGTGTLEFKHDLEVNTMPGVIQSAEATNKAVLQKLNLFEQAFPGCPDGSHEISWKRLTLNDKSGVFLVCGEAKEPEPQCPDPNSGYSWDQRKVWNAQAKRCECEQDYAHFYNGYCCHSGWPKDQSACWEANTPMVTWIENSSYGYETYKEETKPNDCTGSNGVYNTLRYDSGRWKNTPACSYIGAVRGQPCSNYQQQCISLCYVTQTYTPPWPGHSTPEWGITISTLTCNKAAGETTYTQKWSDSAPYY